MGEEPFFLMHQEGIITHHDQSIQITPGAETDHHENERHARSQPFILLSNDTGTTD